MFWMNHQSDYIQKDIEKLIMSLRKLQKREEIPHRW